MLSIESNDHFMKMALRQAELAYEADEVPVGAIIVSQGVVIAKAHNMVENLNDPTAHAEILAITSACNYLGTKFLTDCELFVTLEPCLMCAGALYWSRLKAVHYSASDEKRGFMALGKKVLHPSTELQFGLLNQESSALLKRFFENKR